MKLLFSATQNLDEYCYQNAVFNDVIYYNIVKAGNDCI